MIWQTMMGESKNPKRRWDEHDEEYQHFSCWTGSRKINCNRIAKGDRLVIYWPGPGRRVYMGISLAAESGPNLLDMSSRYWEEVQKVHPDVDKWPYGLKICKLKRIAAVSDGVTLNAARSFIRNTALPGRVGLRNASGWDGSDNLVDLIKSRA